MTRAPKPPAVRVGLLRIRDHCLFTWEQAENGGKSVEIHSSHCADCNAEVRRLGYQLVYKDDADAGSEGPMIPYIHIEPVQIGPLSLQPFGILVALGVVIGFFLAIRRARHVGIDETQLRSFIAWILVGGFVAAHVFDAVFYHPREVLERPWILLALWAGLSSFGGFIGALLGAFAWKYYEMREAFRIGDRFEFVRPVRRQKPIAILPYADVILAVFPVAWIFGRAGCAVVHDHPGARASTESWLAVAYGPGPVDRFGLIELRHGIEPRYDLGLLEMLFTVVLAAAFALTWKRGRASGWYIVAACILYAPVRFALDFLRLEDGDGGDLRYGGLTPAQWACGMLLLFGIGLAFRLRTSLASSVDPSPGSRSGEAIEPAESR